MALRLRPNAKSVRLWPPRPRAFCLNAEAQIDIRAIVSGILQNEIGPDRRLARCV